MLLSDCRVVAKLDTELILVKKNQNTVYSRLLPFSGENSYKTNN